MTAVIVVAAVVGSLRWLRVAQREHYLTGSASRFAWRWWTATPAASALALVGLGAALAAAWWPPAALITAAVVAGGPPGLGLKGRTSPLAWTPRLRRLAGGVALVTLLLVGLGWWLGAPLVLATAVAALPLVVDACLAVLGPLESRLGHPWVDRAARALAASGATVVAITGSYGKTTTKGYVEQLLGGVRRVLASPASFNNRMGLARAINEHLAAGVDVFVAEMGTYGPGEIADLCAWIPPDVAVITAIGPVHLERFKSEDTIVASKAEILSGARAAVLNVDDPRLRALADREEGRRKVVRAGTGSDAEVAVRDGIAWIGNRSLGPVPRSAHPTNVACALGVVVALGVEAEAVAARLAGLAEPDHRLTRATGSTGVLIFDDTFNSNPAGARVALAALAGAEAGGRRVVVTPGMVELGERQGEENRRFARDAAAVADQLVVVGRTNRAALVEGASGGQTEVVVVASRGEAVAWVRENLGEGDVVLYENDLPDHYP